MDNAYVTGVTMSVDKVKVTGVTMSVDKVYVTGVTLSVDRVCVAGVTLSVDKVNVTGVRVDKAVRDWRGAVCGLAARWPCVEGGGGGGRGARRVGVIQFSWAVRAEL